jgi:NAD-dependent DNA ligase
MKASNRQKKLLNFFGIPFSSKLTKGAAGWEIGEIMSDTVNRESWRKYLYLTKDFDSDSPSLADFDASELEKVEVPEAWNASGEINNFNSELVAAEMEKATPFDSPQPDVIFPERTFIFTGKFSFGSRTACQNAIAELGGLTPSRSSVSGEVDFLVIGNEGSPNWKRGSYGKKIESAILSRRNHGRPAIISEDHWKGQIDKA